MKILFTPAGDTDPVRGYHDGAMLHILRHYGADRVIVFLTADMEAKENALHCYTRGIHSVLPDLPEESIKFIKSGITDPQNYENLVQIQESFAAAYQKYPDAEWLLNISSGTPQIKTVMALLALDYPDTKAIQVVSPERSSNRKNHPCTTVEELVEMLECNEDNEPGAKNRCSEPRLLLLRKQKIKHQIFSLIRNYDYTGAWELMQPYRNLFSPVTVDLLQYAYFRSIMKYESEYKTVRQKINQTQYAETKLFGNTDFLTEYFMIMEIRQRNEQLPDFILKLSPFLVALGKKYTNTLAGFQWENCGSENRQHIFKVQVRKIQQDYPAFLAYLDKKSYSKHGTPFRDKALYFWFFVYVCQFYMENGYANNEKHQQITKLFIKLRDIEEAVRNKLAHELINLTEEKLAKMTEEGCRQAYTSDEILRLLKEAYSLVTGKKSVFIYDQLNECIVDSLKE